MRRAIIYPSDAVADSLAMTEAHDEQYSAP